MYARFQCTEALQQGRPHGDFLFLTFYCLGGFVGGAVVMGVVSIVLLWCWEGCFVVGAGGLDLVVGN